MACGRDLVEVPYTVQELGGEGNVRAVATLWIAADPPAHRAAASSSADVGEERAAAGAVGVVVAIEHQLPQGARIVGTRRRRASDRPVRCVRIADDLHKLRRLPIDGQSFRARVLLDALARPLHDQEGNVVVRVLIRRPAAVHVRRSDRPEAIRELAGGEPRCELHAARRGQAPAGYAVRCRDEEVALRAMEDARGAEVPAELAVDAAEQGAHRSRTAERDALLHHSCLSRPGLHGRGIVAKNLRADQGACLSTGSLVGDAGPELRAGPDISTATSAHSPADASTEAAQGRCLAGRTAT